MTLPEPPNDDQMLVDDLVSVLLPIVGAPPPPFELDALQGDASSRRYFRLRFANAVREPIIAMRLPIEALKSDEIGDSTETELPFLQIASLLERANIPVPKVLGHDLAKRLVLLEDLGDTTLESKLRQTPRSEWREIYRSAVELLAAMHQSSSSFSATSLPNRRRFEESLLRWELDHFAEWGLEPDRAPLDETQYANIRNEFDALALSIAKLPTGFVHRDYQSKNIMIDHLGAYRIIDFQDAFTGPRVYDLVALLCDSYVALDLEFQREMIGVYANARRIDAAELESEFWLVALQRKLKDAGRFVFIDRVRGNPRFLQWYPQSIVYVGRALNQVGGNPQLRKALSERIEGFAQEVSVPRAQTGRFRE
ncbi:MAG: phosphotransferase [Polyangiales bacterium]